MTTAKTSEAQAATATTATAQATTATVQATLQTTAAPVPEDRRALRSKRLIREAYLALVAERGLNGFSVGDLTKRADLNRSTFYSHYGELDDLLLGLEDEIITSLESLRPRLQQVKLAELLAFIKTGQPLAVTIELFDLLRAHGILLGALLGARGDAQFHVRLRDQVCANLVASVLYDKYTRDPSPLTEYYIAYYAAALLGLIQHWLERGMPEDSHTMARIMLSIMFLKPGDPIKLQGEKR